MNNFHMKISWFTVVFKLSMFPFPFLFLSLCKVQYNIFDWIYKNCPNWHKNWNPIESLMLMIYTHALPKNIHYLAIDIQVCFHRFPFTYPIKQHWCIMYRIMEPLGSTNQNWLCARLLPIAILIYPVDCVHLCHLLRKQHHCLCSNGKKNLPLACPPTRIPPPTLYSWHLWYYRDCKKVSQKPAVNTTWQSLLWNTGYKNLVWLQCGTGEQQLIFAA